MDNYKVYPNVAIGENASIGDYVVIGVPPPGMKAGELATKIGRNALIRSHTVIYAGNLIGDDFQTGHGVLIREANEIGNRVSIGSSSVVEHHSRIADGVRIHSGAFIPEFSELKNNCWIGPNVVLTNALYPQAKNVKQNLKGPTIMPKAKIGASSTILPGVVINENALVGAGSVVTKDVPAGKVVAGNPARIIKDIKDLPY